VTESRFADNVVHFTRVLRDAGLPAGPDRALAALQALEWVGFEDRARVHAALGAVLVDRHEHQAIFDAAFAAFWRDPKLLERLMYLTLPKVAARTPQPKQARSRRLEEALSPQGNPAPTPSAEEPADEVTLDATLTFSERERLQTADFESMSATEYEQAKALAAKLRLVLKPIPVRRQAPSSRGAIDLRAMMRASARDPLSSRILRRKPLRRDPPLVILIDISGSMQRYSRIFLHWAHALTRADERIETLTMGTRLTRITRMLRQRDPDEALHAAGQQVRDWAGGTRLAGCLAEFNLRWARRLLAANATLVLLTDGLDRDDAGELTRQARRMRGLARRIVWLNPLLRFEGFEPKASGIRALLPYVDDFVPAHNLQSLADLSTLLAQAAGARRPPGPPPHTE
jgi:uncharacterized protein